MEEKGIVTSRLSSFFLGGLRPCFWLSVICFFLYFKTLAFKFTYLDDNELILNNYWFLRDFGNILKCFKQGVFMGELYRPMLLVSLMFDAHFGGASPIVYHFTNILLHAGASVLLFLLFLKLSYSRGISFFISVLFVVHPALTQAVAWIPGRNDSLLAVFAISAFIYFIEYTETAKLKSLIFTVLFFNFALFTKETAIMLIPAGFLYYWLISKEKLNLKHTNMFVWSLMFSVSVRFVVLYFSAVTPQQFTSYFKVSLGEVLPGLLMYLGKIVLPFNLSVYPILQDTPLLYGYISLVFMVAALLLTPRVRLKHSFFGLGWFLLFMLPPFLLPNKMLLEHRLYLPIAGFFIVVAEIDWSKIFLTKKTVLSLGVFLIVLFAGKTFIYSDNFIGRIAFLKNAVKASPHSSAVHSALAMLYLACGEKGLTELEFSKAIELDPENFQAHIVLGIIYTEKRMFMEAEREFKKANKIKTDMDVFYYNYGLLCFEEGRDRDAVNCWEKTLELNPDYILAFRSLAAYYFINGDTAKTAYYAKQLKDKFSYSIDLPSSTIMNKRGWLYYCVQQYQRN